MYWKFYNKNRLKRLIREVQKRKEKLKMKTKSSKLVFNCDNVTSLNFKRCSIHENYKPGPNFNSWLISWII